MSEFPLYPPPPPLPAALEPADPEPAAEGALPTSVRWGVWQALGVVVFVFVSNVFASLMAHYIADSPSAPMMRSLGAVSVFACAYALQVGLVALAGRRAGSRLLPAVALDHVPRGWSWAAWTAAAVVLARFAGVFLVALLDSVGLNLPEPSANPLDVFGEGPLGIVFAALTLLVLAPLTEEIVFRGVVLPAAGDRWGVVAGVLVSATLFAAIHFQPLVMLVVLPGGVAFALLAVRFRSLWAAILGHSLFNAISLLALLGFLGGGRA